MAMAVMVLTAILPAHPWPCFQGDARHIGRSELAVGDSLWVAWTFDAPDEVSGSAAVNRSGQVLFGARNVHLYCLNPDGSLAWDANLESLGTSIYYSTPALDEEGNAYITTNRRLVKVDPTGTVVWRYPAHAAWSISHSPVIGADGRIYFSSYADSLCAVRPDGILDWAHHIELDCNSVPAVGDDGRVYVATTRGTGGWKLWAFEPGGEVAWTFGLDAGVEFSSPTVGPDSTIYVGAGRYFYAIRPDGSLRRRDSLPATINSSPAVADDTTLYLTAGVYLYSMSTETGIRWRKHLGGTNYSSPAVDADGRVFVGSTPTTDPAFYVIAPDSSVLWSMTTAGRIWASPAIGSSGRVYVGCMNGTFYAFEGPGLAAAEPSVPVVRAGLSAVPSPTTGRVRLAGWPSIEAVRVRVFDPAGRSVAVRRAGSELDLGGLPAGVYLVEVRDRESVAVVRVSKQ
ncbi:MAG: PQQ-binding-like beta-propeller repeat protein [bacterium]